MRPVDIIYEYQVFMYKEKQILTVMKTGEVMHNYRFNRRCHMQ